MTAAQKEFLHGPDIKRFCLNQGQQVLDFTTVDAIIF